MIEKLKELRSLVENLNENIKALKSEMQTIVLKSNLRNEPKDIVSMLYWGFPEIPSDVILQSLKDTNIRKYIEPLHLYTCKKCGFEIYAKSRSNQKDIDRHYRNKQLSCPQCKKDSSNARTETSIVYWKQRKERLNTLKTMPYQEYLQTPEWQETRKSQLKKAGYACQVCNKSKTILDVHHRTYEHRGEEDSKDLIVLCGDCHDIFYRHGKLIKHQEQAIINQVQATGTEAQH